MRPFVAVFLVIITILFFENVSDVAAQFLEAGVSKFEKPIDAPHVKLKDLGRGEISTGELKGKVVLLEFFDPYSAICQKSAVALDKLYDVMKSKDLAILHVAVKGKEKDLVKFRDKYAISQPILIDQNRTAAKAFRVSGHPETFFINRQEKIVGKALGEKDWTSKAMKDLVNFLLAQGK